MPVYEYHCKTCEDSFEVLRPMGAMAVGTCPEGHAGVTKVLSTFATVSKADGCVSTAALPDTPCNPGGCACCN